MNICQRCKKPTRKTIALNDASDLFCSRLCQEADEREFEQSLRRSSDAERLDELEQEISNADEVVARQWGTEGRSIEGDLEWLIDLGRKGLTLGKHIATQEHYRETQERADRYEKALREIYKIQATADVPNQFSDSLDKIERIAREALNSNPSAETPRPT